MYGVLVGLGVASLAWTVDRSRPTHRLLTHGGLGIGTATAVVAAVALVTVADVREPASLATVVLLAASWGWLLVAGVALGRDGAARTARWAPPKRSLRQSTGTPGLDPRRSKARYPRTGLTVAGTPSTGRSVGVIRSSSRASSGTSTSNWRTSRASTSVAPDSANPRPTQACGPVEKGM